MMCENLRSEAKLKNNPRLKIVSSRCVRNSISLKRLFKVSRIKPEASKSAVSDRESNEIKARIENMKDGIYVFSENTFLSISIIPKKALCESRIRKAKMCRMVMDRP